MWKLWAVCGNTRWLQFFFVYCIQYMRAVLRPAHWSERNSGRCLPLDNLFPLHCRRLLAHMQLCVTKPLQWLYWQPCCFCCMAGFYDVAAGFIITSLQAVFLPALLHSSGFGLNIIILFFSPKKCYFKLCLCFMLSMPVYFFITRVGFFTDHQFVGMDVWLWFGIWNTPLFLL